MFKQDLNDLKVGDKVYSIVNGPGVVEDTNNSPKHRYAVAFDNDHAESFTTDGKSDISDVHQTLFKGDKHPFEAFNNPLGVLPGDVIEVWDDEEDTWQERFAGYIHGAKYPWITINSYGDLEEYCEVRLPKKPQPAPIKIVVNGEVVKTFDEGPFGGLNIEVEGA